MVRNSHEPNPRTASTPAPLSYLTILGLQVPYTEDAVRQAFREAAKTAHPDGGGTQERFVELQRAYEKALQHVHDKPGPRKPTSRKAESGRSHPAAVFIRLRYPKAADRRRVVSGVLEAVAASLFAVCAIWWLLRPAEQVDDPEVSSSETNQTVTVSDHPVDDSTSPTEFPRQSRPGNFKDEMSEGVDSRRSAAEPSPRSPDTANSASVLPLDVAQPVDHDYDLPSQPIAAAQTPAQSIDSVLLSALVTIDTSRFLREADDFESVDDRTFDDVAAGSMSWDQVPQSIHTLLTDDYARSARRPVLSKGAAVRPFPSRASGHVKDNTTLPGHSHFAEGGNSAVLEQFIGTDVPAAATLRRPPPAAIPWTYGRAPDLSAPVVQSANHKRPGWTYDSENLDGYGRKLSRRSILPEEPRGRQNVLDRLFPWRANISQGATSRPNSARHNVLSQYFGHARKSWHGSGYSSPLPRRGIQAYGFDRSDQIPFLPDGTYYDAARYGGY